MGQERLWRPCCLRLRFNTPLKRDDLLKFFEEATVDIQHINDIVQFSNGVVDLTLKNKARSIKVNRILQKQRVKIKEIPRHGLCEPVKVKGFVRIKVLYVLR